ncbi:MAG TPA: hypothetical protein ENI69_05705 [Rhodospirillales bacterium]|nr:hypothetical protein [Rhodospirillales bacterium]
MGEILNTAFQSTKKLPLEDQERIAWEIIERVENNAEWDRIVATAGSQHWLETQAKKALKEYENISKKITGCGRKIRSSLACDSREFIPNCQFSPSRLVCNTEQSAWRRMTVKLFGSGLARLSILRGR